MNRHVLIRIMIAWLLFWQASTYAKACDDCEKIQAPRIWLPDGDSQLDQLPLKSSRAEVKINGPIAQVTVTQRYQNTGTRAIHARYVFPGSTRSAVHGLTMKLGEQIIKAKIKEKEQAKQDYADAKQAGKTAALLTQQRPNVFMMDTANIMPGDEIELELKYSELLLPEAGVYQFVYPTVVGPRYGGDPVKAAQDADWAANPYAANDPAQVNPAAIQTSINLQLQSPIAIQDLQSLQHKIETQWHDSVSADIRLAQSETEAGNRDFILRFRLQDKQIVSGVMTYEAGDDNYFLAMVQPPKRIQAEQIMPREYIFVVDVSGSMHGFALDTAKAMMKDLLTGLKPHETFNIVLFAGDSKLLSAEPLTASPGNIQNAIAFMQRYHGGGGTELIAALETAYAMPRTTELARSLVVLTDGFVSAEREAYDLIAEHLNTTNLFAVGIGSSVNRYLIESMAHAGAGEPFIVTGNKDVKPVGTRFRQYVQAPLLTNIKIQGKNVELYDNEPADIPVMMAERPIIVFGKYRNAEKSAALQVTGTSAGAAYHQVLPLPQAQQNKQADLLPLLWARYRLMQLSDFAGSRVEKNRDAIVELGLKYSLLTRYTAFIAVDETIVNPDAKADEVRQALPLPQGVTISALGYRPMPEPDLILLIAMLMILLGWKLCSRERVHAQA